MVEAAAARLDPSRRRHTSSSAALFPSDSNASYADADAAAAARKPNPKPKLKVVASRYLTPFSSSSSSSKPPSISSSSSTSTATSSRRSTSPATRRPAERLLPVLPNADAAAPTSGCGTATRTFSVAFQTPSYSLDSTKARGAVVLPAALAVIAPEKRRSKNAVAVAAPRGKVSDIFRWPAAVNAATCVSDGGALAKKGAPASILAAVRPTASDETTPRRASVGAAEYLHSQALSSDMESAYTSGGSRDGVAGAGAGAGVASKARPSPRSIMSTSARFAVGSRSDRFADQATPFSGAASSSPRTAPAKKKSLFNKNTEHCSSNKKGTAASILAAVPSTVCGETTPQRASADGAEYLHMQALSSDTESASSSGSQAGAGAGVASEACPSPRSIMSTSSRFLTGSRSERFAGHATPFLPRTSGVASSSPRTAPVKKKSLLNTFLSSPFGRSSPRQPLPVMPSASSPRTATAFAGKLQGKGSTHCNPDNDMRRKAHGDHKAEEEHLLRILNSRHLQWRRANAQAAAALSAQKLTAEKHLRGAWIAILAMRRSVALRKIQLQFLRNDCKLMAILRGQMIYLEEWSLMEKRNANSLSGTVGALNATILRVPVSDGAVADIQAVKNAVGSAVDVMQTIGNSTSTLVSKLAPANASASQLSGIAIQECALMVQCRELLSTLASMHVKYCSLQGHRVQLQLTKRRLKC